MKIVSKILFFLARVFLRRGLVIGQWFHNKAILIATGVRAHRD